jgi:hypothetical protein
MKKDSSLVFDGLATGTSYTQSSKFRSNQYTGHSNDGRLVNKGRGPTRGNMDTERGREEFGSEEAPRRAPSSVPDTHAPSAYGMPQYRGPSGTTVKCPPNSDSINAGRGPRRGNQ